MRISNVTIRSHDNKQIVHNLLNDNYWSYSENLWLDKKP